MSTWHAAGFLFILLPPALLALGAATGKPYLAAGAVFMVFPLMRLVFGALPSSAPHLQPRWPAWVASTLYWLPVAYVPWLLAALAVVLMHMAGQPPTAITLLGHLLSLWVTMVFAGCVAHELIHRREPVQRLLGHLLAGLAGYPCFAQDHLRHHRRPGNTAAAEWPLLTDSVWRYAAKRLPRVLASAYGPSGDAWLGRANHPAVVGLRVALAATVATAAAFAATAGARGLALYLTLAGLLAFSVQLITYLQHWGLGDDHIPEAAAKELGWEDDCRFQAWLTLNLSLHHVHHQSPGAPYPTLLPHPASPRLPAGYVVLMFLVLVPDAWRAAMREPLYQWITAPQKSTSGKRRLTCFGLTDR